MYKTEGELEGNKSKIMRSERIREQQYKEKYAEVLETKI